MAQMGAAAGAVKGLEQQWRGQLRRYNQLSGNVAHLFERVVNRPEFLEVSVQELWVEFLICTLDVDYITDSYDFSGLFLPFASYFYAVAYIFEAD
jgi:hypothetical protein